MRRLTGRSGTLVIAAWLTMACDGEPTSPSDGLPRFGFVAGNVARTDGTPVSASVQARPAAGPCDAPHDSTAGLTTVATDASGAYLQVVFGPRRATTACFRMLAVAPNGDSALSAVVAVSLVRPDTARADVTFP